MPPLLFNPTELDTCVGGSMSSCKFYGNFFFLFQSPPVFVSEFLVSSVINYGNP